MNRQLVAMLLVVIVTASSSAIIGYAYLDSTNKRLELESRNKQLAADYASLNSQYSALNTLYNDLSSDYESLNGTYLALNNEHADLSANHATLSKNYTTLSESYANLSKEHEELSLTYSRLLADYETLDQSYLALQTQYSQLEALYSQLQADYSTLSTAYSSLYQEHQALEKLLNEPLDYVAIPTWDEVEQWLESDKTDEILYDSEKFLCGDFSIMLIQHAKAMSWRMLFTVIEFDYYFENPSGTESHHGNHGHAFVSIFTTEGIIYIEPQSDYMWYLYDEGDPDTHIEFEDWKFIDFESDWFGHIFVQYYNRMGVPSVSEQNSNLQTMVATRP